MKILWVSNAPWSPSGYGSQTRQVGRRLLAAGYEVEFSANDGSRGSREWEGALVRGSGSDRYSRDKVREDLERSGADWAIVLYDPWVYTQQTTDPFIGHPHVAGWVPVDHFPVPPSLHQWLSQHTAIAMSQFGQSALSDLSEAMKAKNGQGFPVRYAPHAIEPVYSPRDRSAFRRDIEVPDDAFLVGIVAANIGTLLYDRKGWSDMLQAAGRFMEAHRDAYLYLHTLEQGYEAINLRLLVQMLGMDQSRLRLVDQYRYKEQGYSDDDMAVMYSALDVLLATSRGEGFGIPVIEAQACGTPVVVSNFTAQPELVGEPWHPARPESRKDPSGWVVTTLPDYDSRQAAWFGKPHPAGIAVALDDCYRNHRGDETIRQAAIANVAKYAADRVFDEHWRPILADMEAALRTPNRAERRASKKARKLRVVA